MLKKSLILGILLSSFTAQAQVLGSLNQNWVMGFGILANIIRSPQELIQALNKPSLRNQFDNYVIKQADSSLEKTNLCKDICPEDFSILSDGHQKMQPENGENLLDFLNEKVDFLGSHQRTLGYCWGHTTLTRKFNYLAYFDGDNLGLEEIPEPKGSRTWRRFYKKKIQKILRGHATTIPGFSNLREFTQDADIKKIMKLKTVNSWWGHAVRMSAIPVFFKNFQRPMIKDEVDSLISDIEFKLSQFITPKIYMANLGNPMFMHIISVYKVIHDDDNSTRLCILDNHQYEEGLRDCQTYLRANSDGRLYYPGWEEPERNLTGWVRRFGYTPEDLRETIQFTKERIRMCKKITNCEEATNSALLKY